MKKLAKIDSMVRIKKDLVINRKFMTKFINRAGISMLKYKFYLVITRNGDYKIGDPQEYIRIAKTLNSPDKRFVKINNDLINISTIDTIKEQVGYMPLEEAK